jgi:ribosomal RNA-processing protein 12
MTQEQLAPLLPEVVGGIMKYNKCAERFRAKIKIILKKLVRVYGYEAIKALVPPDHSRLITHMRKLSERAARRKATGVQDGRPDIQHGFDNMMDSDEDDSDDGRTFLTGVTGFTRMTSMSAKSTRSAAERTAMSKSVARGAKSIVTNKSAVENGRPRIKKELNGEILDMLDDSKMARSVHFANVDASYRDFSDDDDDDDEGGANDFEFDNLGRMIISEDISLPNGKEADADDIVERNSFEKRRRVSKLESVKLNNAEKDRERGSKQKAERTSTTTLFGAAYKSKKAGGDVKKKGQKYEPYAYVPLDAKDFTKKNRGKAVSKMGSVVRSNKRKR